jgi:hypothetical protein
LLFQPLDIHHRPEGFTTFMDEIPLEEVSE